MGTHIRMYMHIYTYAHNFKSKEGASFGNFQEEPRQFLQEEIYALSLFLSFPFYPLYLFLFLIFPLLPLLPFRLKKVKMKKEI